MAYRLELSKRAKKDLDKIDGRFLSRIYSAMAVIELDPFSGKKLEGEHRGKWSYRVWPYRIVYKIHKHELIVLVIGVGHRQGVYK